VSFCVLFVCKCVLYYCHRVSTQLQLINISISISIATKHGPEDTQLSRYISHDNNNADTYVVLLCNIIISI